MDAPSPASEFHEAVRLVDAALHARGVLDMASLDRSLATMVTAHAIVGSAARARLRRVFAASYVDTDTLREAVAAFGRYLAQQRAETEPGAAPSRRVRAHRNQRTSSGQLRFDLDS
jgi:hypothetical protein